MNDSEQQVNLPANPEVHLEDADRLMLPKVDERLLRDPEASVDTQHEPLVVTPEEPPEVMADDDNQFHTKTQTDDSTPAKADGDKDTILSPGQAVAVIKKAQLPAKPIDQMTDKEKEDYFVDKAKNVIHMTKNNPHRREEEIKDLREDYVFSRYGLDIKKDKQG